MTAIGIEFGSIRSSSIRIRNESVLIALPTHSDCATALDLQAAVGQAAVGQAAELASVSFRPRPVSELVMLTTRSSRPSPLTSR